MQLSLGWPLLRLQFLLSCKGRERKKGFPVDFLRCLINDTRSFPKLFLKRGMNFPSTQFRFRCCLMINAKFFQHRNAGASSILPFLRRRRRNTVNGSRKSNFSWQNIQKKIKANVFVCRAQTWKNVRHI